MVGTKLVPESQIVIKALDNKGKEVSYCSLATSFVPIEILELLKARDFANNDTVELELFAIDVDLGDL